jgi:transposase, IS30 family
MTYKQIGNEDYACISKMLKADYSYSEIARTIDKNVSSVSRHVRDNGGRDNYDVREVKRGKRYARISAMNTIRVIKGALLRSIITMLKEHLSPEQISGRLAQKERYISASTIYRYIKERAPHLKMYLRSQKGKYRRKRGTRKRELERELGKKRRIDERPLILESRGRLGDFEGDTVMGSDKRVRIVTYVDRRSGFLIAFLLPKMNAELLSKLTIKYMLSLSENKRKTITYDNGVEFSDWESIENKTNMTVYFCYPYHSWERGTNENTNGLLRQYFPKKYDFNLITEDELKHIVKKLNDRPRKRLGYKTPKEVFVKGLRLG